MMNLQLTEFQIFFFLKKKWNKQAIPANVSIKDVTKARNRDYCTISDSRRETYKRESKLTSSKIKIQAIAKKNMQERQKQYRNGKEPYNAILKEFGAFRDGLAGVVDDRVCVVLDGAGEVVLVPHLHGLAHRRSQPRHFPKRLGRSPTDWKFSKKK
jgi:hypothetical protein